MQTTQALVAAFERESGISVNVRLDDEDVLADQIVAEGRRSPADVFFTENSPPLQYLASKGCWPRSPQSTLAQHAGKYNSPNGQMGRCLGPGERHGLQHQAPDASRPADARRWNWRTPNGAASIAIAGGETDFQPIVTSIARTYGNHAALNWLNAIKANAGGHNYPDNETVTSAVNNGQVALGIINQYYWYRERAQVGASGMHSAIAYFAPHDVGYVLNVSGAGVLRSSTHQKAAQRFLAFLTSAQGQEIIAHSDSFEYPIGSGVTTAQPETPFAALQPNDITIAELGTGAEAIKLLQEAQLL